jgi:hypothetical protein
MELNPDLTPDRGKNAMKKEKVSKFMNSVNRFKSGLFENPTPGSGDSLLSTPS